MFVRLALETDLDDIVEMARQAHEETLTDAPPFSERKVREGFQAYLDTASPTVWVVEQRRELIGMLLATISEYRFADGLYTTQELLFVKPENRGSRAAALMMKELIQWSAMLGAKEITGGVDNDYQSERTAKFLQHFGFKQVGIFMRRVMKDG